MNIMIIGSNGYTGSRIHSHLAKLKHNVTGIDLNWFGNPSNHPYRLQDFADITAEQYAQYDAIILLAGHSSVNMCKNDLYSSYNNNVHNFARMLQRINKQLVIYASSSSVYGNHPKPLATETDGLHRPVNAYDCTKQIIDQLALTSNKNCVGLRFGTVCGPSANFRKDVMINAMTHNAIRNKQVQVFNGNTRRSILCIDDLCSAVETILNRWVSNDEVSASPHSGVFNIASFHSTSLSIGETVAAVVGVPLTNADVVDSFNEKMCQTTYDFHVDTTAFCEQYNFAFQGTCESITQNIVSQYTNCLPTDRNQEITYE
jgi:nucleoside-diphosphate-sugar epimerase